MGDKIGFKTTRKGNKNIYFVEFRATKVQKKATIKCHTLYLPRTFSFKKKFFHEQCFFFGKF